MTCSIADAGTPMLGIAYMSGRHLILDIDMLPPTAMGVVINSMHAKAKVEAEGLAHADAVPSMVPRASEMTQPTQHGVRSPYVCATCMCCLRAAPLAVWPNISEHVAGTHQRCQPRPASDMRALRGRGGCPSHTQLRPRQHRSKQQPYAGWPCGLPHNPVAHTTLWVQPTSSPREPSSAHTSPPEVFMHTPYCGVYQHHSPPEASMHLLAQRRHSPGQTTSHSAMTVRCPPPRGAGMGWRSSQPPRRACNAPGGNAHPVPAPHALRG
jgi:hypothetical protein